MFQNATTFTALQKTTALSKGASLSVKLIIGHTLSARWTQAAIILLRELKLATELVFVFLEGSRVVRESV